jgi:hypothetical protein
VRLARNSSIRSQCRSISIEICPYSTHEPVKSGHRFMVAEWRVRAHRPYRQQPILKGARRGSPEHNPADSLACSGLRAQLRLEQQLLRLKDGDGLWWDHFSSEIIVEISDGKFLLAISRELVSRGFATTLAAFPSCPSLNSQGKGEG